MTEFLSLTKLDGFSIAEEVTFKAVGVLCPHLRGVSLCGFHSERDIFDPRAVMTTPMMLEAVLKDWPKVIRLIYFI